MFVYNVFVVTILKEFSRYEEMEEEVTQTESGLQNIAFIFLLYDQFGYQLILEYL